MAQLWGGRFTKETDKLVYNFNASISFDQKFYAQDIRGSIAHVTTVSYTHLDVYKRQDEGKKRESDHSQRAGRRSGYQSFHILPSF